MATQMAAIQAPAKLVALLNLIPKAQLARSSAELNFLVVNLTHQLVPYSQAFLYFADEGVVAISGVSEIQRHAPFVIWLARWMGHLAKQNHSGEVSVETLPVEFRTTYHEWLPRACYLLPLRDESRLTGYFAMCRDEPFQQDELAHVTYWINAWHHARRLCCLKERGVGTAILEFIHRFWRAGTTPGRSQKRALFTSRCVLWAAVLLAVSCLPVRLTVMAPAEIVPANPTVVRAPIDGVLETFFIDPNASVGVGQKLFSYDNASLASRLDVAKQALASAEAEYRQSATLSLSDPKSKPTLALLERKIEEKRIEQRYLAGQYHKSIVTAPVAGIAILDDPTEFIGKPVVTGEKVMSIANADDVEIQAWLSLGDRIDLEPGDDVKVYLNPSPFGTVAGHVRYIGYEPSQQPDGSFAYRLRAVVEDRARLPRLGLKGVAKISGRYVALAYWVFRRPLTVARQTIGL